MPELGIPEAPDWLSEEALKEWTRITEELETIGLIAKIDQALLAMYCQLYGNFVDAQRKGRQVHASDVAQIRALAASFGLEPSSRARLSTPKDGKKNKWSDLGG